MMMKITDDVNLSENLEEILSKNRRAFYKIFLRNNDVLCTVGSLKHFLKYSYENINKNILLKYSFESQRL